MKWKLSLLAVAALGVGLAVYALRPGRGVHFAAFEPRMAQILQDDGLAISEIAPYPNGDVTLPLNILLDPRRLLQARRHAAIGFPDSTEQYMIVAQGVPPFNCLVRYMNGWARVIVLRGQPSPVLTELKLRLTTEFPGIAVREEVLAN